MSAHRLTEPGRFVTKRIHARIWCTPDLICKPPTGGEDSCRKIIAVLTSLIKFMPTLAAIGLC